MDALNIPSPLELIETPFLNANNIQFYVKRDDLIHPQISGNKWRKLKLNLEKCRQGNYDALLTFGGAYSNHIAATAALGRLFGLNTIGMIRGDELSTDSNETLKMAASDGMNLHFISREEYSWRYETDYKNELRARFGNIWIVEEGGANFYGMMGCTEIIGEIEIQPDYYCLPVGTGTTIAGLLMAENKAKIIGVPALANGAFLRDEILSLLRYGGLTEEDLEEKSEQLLLATKYAFGGYGKSSPKLIRFMNEFYLTTGLKLDYVYTAKAFYALHDLIKEGRVEKGSKVVALHTGGLQGNQSIRHQLSFD